MIPHDEYRRWLIGGKQPGEHTRDLPRKAWRVRVLHFPGERLPGKKRFLRLAVLPYLILTGILILILLLEVAL